MRKYNTYMYLVLKHKCSLNFNTYDFIEVKESFFLNSFINNNKNESHLIDLLVGNYETITTRKVS
jgi:hypothetical protein